MPTAAVGANVGIYYDGLQKVQVGDFIRTRTKRTYLVTSVRVQERGASIGRQHLRCDVVPSDTPQDDDVVHPLFWYTR
jgi:hypothetical protein